MSGLSIYYLFTYLICANKQCGDGLLAFINVAGQATLIFSAALIAYSMVRRDPLVVWTPAFAFIVSSALYYGFGNMAWVFADEESLSYYRNHVYGISLYELIRANVLTMVGITFCTLGIIVTLNFQAQLCGSFKFLKGDSFSIGQITFAFLALGLLLKYGLILPANFGITGNVVPGALANLVFLADIGFCLAAFLATRGSRRWCFWFWLLWPLHLSLGTLEFSKKVVMFAILLPAIGTYMAHRSVWRTVPWLLCAAILFTLLQSLNSTGRVAASLAAEGQVVVGLEERLSIVREMFFEERVSGMAPIKATELQAWWFRLSYAGAQIRAMELYDAGNPGQWFQSPLVYFVPRFVWPGKPTMVSPGQIFHREVTGYELASTRVGISVYADGYWQHGWLGAILYSLMMGVIFGVITVFSIDQVRRHDFIFLPAIFLGLQMAALGPHGYFQNSIVGAVPIYIGYLFLIWAGGRIWALRKPGASLSGRFLGGGRRVPQR